MYQITIINDGVRQILHTDDPNSTQRIAAGTLKEYVGQTPSLTVTVTPQNACYNMLIDRNTIAELKNTENGVIEFEGYLLKSPESMSSKGTLQKKLTFEGFLGYLNDSVQDYHTYDDAQPSFFLTALLEYHNATTEAGKHIYLGSVDAGQGGSKTTAYRSTLAEIKENLINRFGGELRIRRGDDGKLLLDYLTAATNGSTADTIIMLGHNLRSLSIESDTANIITRLMPLGAQLDEITPSTTGTDSAERLTIVGAVDPDDGHTYAVPYIDDSDAIARYGVIVGTAEFDDITVKENLVSRGKSYLSENNRVKKHYAASVLDISGKGSIRCGDTYRFCQPLMGLDENLRLLGRTVDILKPYTPQVEIGDKTAKITDITAKTQHIVNYEIPTQLSQTVQTAQRIAGDMISRATGGYITLKQNQDGTGTAELIISDVPDYENAHNVWVWNQNGLCHADSYPPGPGVNAAITMDGHIVGEYIAAGSINADKIHGGILTLGGLDNVNGLVEVKDASGNTICRLDKEGANILGQMLTRDANGYWMRVSNGKLYGGHNNDTIGSIDATYAFSHEGTPMQGIKIEAGGIHLVCTGLAINGGACTSGTITYVTDVTPVTETRDFVVDDGNGGQTTETLTVCTDIQTATSTITFVNGLMVTGV